jgi:hypothetical protein
VINCFFNEGEGDTCDGEGCNYDSCTCRRAHHHGNTIRKLDPRLNLEVGFKKLPPCQILELFLKITRSNFPFINPNKLPSPRCLIQSQVG